MKQIMKGKKEDRDEHHESGKKEREREREILKYILKH